MSSALTGDDSVFLAMLVIVSSPAETARRPVWLRDNVIELLIDRCSILRLKHHLIRINDYLSRGSISFIVVRLLGGLSLSRYRYRNPVSCKPIICSTHSRDRIDARPNVEWNCPKKLGLSDVEVSLVPFWLTASARNRAGNAMRRKLRVTCIRETLPTDFAFNVFNRLVELRKSTRTRCTLSVSRLLDSLINRRNAYVMYVTRYVARGLISSYFLLCYFALWRSKIIQIRVDRTPIVRLVDISSRRT